MVSRTNICDQLIVMGILKDAIRVSSFGAYTRSTRVNNHTPHSRHAYAGGRAQLSTLAIDSLVKGISIPE